MFKQLCSSPIVPSLYFRPPGLGVLYFMEKTLLIHVQVSPCLISQLPGIFLLPCHSLNCFLEDHLWSFKCYSSRCFLEPILGWVTLLLLPIPLQSGHAIIISWSSSSHSHSHKGLIPKLQPAPPAHPPTGLVPMLQPKPYFPYILHHCLISSFFIYFLAIPLIMQDLSSQARD